MSPNKNCRECLRLRKRIRKLQKENGQLINELSRLQSENRLTPSWALRKPEPIGLSESELSTEDILTLSKINVPDDKYVFDKSEVGFDVYGTIEPDGTFKEVRLPSKEATDKDQSPGRSIIDARKSNGDDRHH